MKKNTIRLNESQLQQIIKESVKRVVNEAWWGGSSSNGYEYDYKNDCVRRNQGGAFGGSKLDQVYDSNKAQQNREAEQRQQRYSSNNVSYETDLAIEYVRNHYGNGNESREEIMRDYWPYVQQMRDRYIQKYKK